METSRSVEHSTLRHRKTLLNSSLLSNEDRQDGRAIDCAHEALFRHIPNATTTHAKAHQATNNSPRRVCLHQRSRAHYRSRLLSWASRVESAARVP